MSTELLITVILIVVILVILVVIYIVIRRRSISEIQRKKVVEILHLVV